MNVERLKTYRARLILFPRRANRPKKNDSSKDEIAALNSGDARSAQSLKLSSPYANAALQEALGEVEKSELGKGTENAYRVLREARSDARLVGVREKRAKAKADEANAAKK